MVGGLSVDCVLMTREGLVPLSWLKADDLVETRDDGFQAIVRIETFDALDELSVDLGGGVLAGQHVLAAGWPVEMYCGFDEMLAIAGDVAEPVLTDAPQKFARIVLNKPGLVRVGDFWMESHGAGRPLHPVLSRDEVNLVNRAFGCPVVRCVDKASVLPLDDLTTFGSRAAVA